MFEFERLPVCLRGGALWNRPLSAGAVSLHIAHLFNHDFRGNERKIYPLVGVDMSTRRRMENLPELRKKKTHDYRNINKALANELLTALLLTHLNAASEVRTYCVTHHHGLPNNFSPSGNADVAARYLDTSNNRSYRLVVETSARHHPGPVDFETQLTQAWDRASELAEDKEGGEVYALVITACQIGSDDGWGEIFRKFVQKKKMSREGPVRVIPVYAGDLIVATRRMEENLSAGALQFTPAVLAGIFDALFSQLIDSSAQSGPNPDWMCDLWVEMVEMAEQEAVQNRQLDLEPGSSADGGSAPTA